MVLQMRNRPFFSEEVNKSCHPPLVMDDKDTFEVISHNIQVLGYKGKLRNVLI